MNTAWIAENVYDPTTWEKHETDNISKLLSSKWTALPDGARIYWKYVATSNDVTPHDEASVDRLEKLSGTFFVMLYPEGPILIIAIIAIVLAAVAIAATFLFRPNSRKLSTSSSPNNELSDRTNTARPNERIPDIVGTVRAVPDVIQPPYRVFIGNQEVEYGYYCVGNGSFTISKATAVLGGADLWDIKDDITPVQQIDGASVAVYAPNTSPNSGDAPQLQLGAAITQPIINVSRSSSVIGQVLRAPNDTTVTGDGSIRATSAGTFECDDTNIDFTAYFGAGDSVTVDATPFSDPGGIIADTTLDGTYTLLSVTSNTLTFATPSTVNAHWSIIATMTGGASNYVSPTISEVGTNRWVGPFILDITNMTEIWCNFVAPQGLYKISGDTGTQYRIDDVIEIEVTPLDSNYNPIGSSRYFSTTVIGSAVLQSQRASTLKAVLPLRTDGKPAGRVSVRAQRLSGYDPTWKGTNADQVQWRDLYAISPVDKLDFGDVTTIQTMSFATASALVDPQRKLNLEVTRNVRIDYSGGPWTLQPSKNAADVILHLALDPTIGNRPMSEVDIDGIYATLGVGGDVDTYFGTSMCCEFCYTFDDSQTTFEEMMLDIGQAVFCTPYRRASVLSFFFEKLTDIGVILFNHRNKIPRSETRTVSFGLNSDYDGINLDYIDPAAPNYPQVETTVTLYFPTDQSAQNPKQIKTVGVRNNVQAQLLGWRFYNKLLNQNTATEFKSTAEAGIVINSQRILVADNTRPDTQDGDVVAALGLVLTLSQPVVFIGGKDYVIFLQLADATIENIPITAGATDHQVILARAPSLPLVTDDAMFKKTTYQIANPPNLTFQSKHLVLDYIDADHNSTITCSDVDFSDCEAGDQITLVNVLAIDIAGIEPTVDVSGTYTIVSVNSALQITIDGVFSFIDTFEDTISKTTSGRMIVERDQFQPITPFLLTKKDAEDGNIYNVQAVNYDDRYYANDGDFLNGALLLNDLNVSDAPFPTSGGGGGGSV